jgi:hypothetical protein
MAVDPASIDENHRRQMSGNPSEYAESDHWCRDVCRSSENLFIFLRFLCTEHTSSTCQIFVLKHMRTMIDLHHSHLPLYEIQSTLCSISSDLFESAEVLSRVGELVGYIARLIYQKDDKFCLVPDAQSMEFSRMDWAIFSGVLVHMDEHRSDCPWDVHRSLALRFADQFLDGFAAVAFRAMETQPEAAVHLLKNCLTFGHAMDDRSSPIRDFIFAPFTETAIYEQLLAIVSAGESLAQAEAVDILKLIAQAHYLDSFVAIMVADFMMKVMGNRDFFRSAGNKRAFIRFFNALHFRIIQIREIAFAPACTDFLFDVIGTDLFLTHEVAPIVIDKLSQSRLNLPELIPKWSGFLLVFCESALREIDAHPLTAYHELLMDPRPLRKIVKNMLLMSDFPAAADIVKGIGDRIVDLSEAQTVSDVANVKLGFLLALAHPALKFEPGREFASAAIEMSAFLIDSVFRMMQNTENKVLAIQTDDKMRPFPMEEHLLFFLKAVLGKYYRNKLQAAVFTDFPEIKACESPQATAVFIFQRLFADCSAGICVTAASRGLSVFVDHKSYRTLDCLLATDIPEYFLDHYPDLPCKSFLYHVLARIMTMSPSDGVPARVMMPFLSSLAENFARRDDEPSLKRLFKLLTELFGSSQNLPEWCVLYRFFSPTFGETCLQCSNSPHWKLVLNFIQQVIASAPQSNPFKSHLPHSLRLFKYFVQILTNFAVNLAMQLGQIDVDESIYETAFTVSESCSAPLGLREARSSGLNQKQQKLKSNRMPILVKKSDDNAWAVLASVICSASLLLASPFPNFGILEMYGDTCVFQMIDAIFERLSETTTVSLLAHPNLVNFLSEFIVNICTFFRPSVVSNPTYWEFILGFLKVSFLSHVFDVINCTCRSLGLIVKDFTSAEELGQLKTHFVLALNVSLQSAECVTAREFIAAFASLDPEFAITIGDAIASDLGVPETKEQFITGYRFIWDQPGVDARDWQVIDTAIQEFQSRVCPLSLKLFTLPSLHTYFSFR